MFFLNFESTDSDKMFRKTPKSSQANLFTQTDSLLPEKSRQIYCDTTQWHNQFREQVLQHINEDIFSCLYSSKMGAPNASIRLLIGMIILKEGFGWSDAELFQECRFNLLARSALGLQNTSDLVPTESTYYLLRKRISDHYQSSGKDLMQQVFEQVTSAQIMEFEVNGRSIRMDSKLVGSNIAMYSRYELVHRSLKAYIDKADRGQWLTIDAELIAKIYEVCQDDSGKIVYRSSKQEINERLLMLGELIYGLVESIKDKTVSYQNLVRVFEEQFEIVEGEVCLRKNIERPGSTLQSPDDPDCGYTSKAGNRVKGYNVNLTETSNPQNKVNLITSVQVAPANALDADFVKEAIEGVEKLTHQPVKQVFMDGGFHSKNAEEKFKGIDLVFTGLQGFNSRFVLVLNGNELIVFDTSTSQTYQAVRCKTKSQTIKKWRASIDGKSYYFDQNAVNAAIIRNKILERSPEERKRRNNVEATIFHFSQHLRQKKTRYRGLIKHKCWGYCRGMWVNLIRIITAIKDNPQTSPAFCISMINCALNTIVSRTLYLKTRIMRQYLAA